MNKIKAFLNRNELVVNLEKTNILETMMKQKRSLMKGRQPQLSVIKQNGEMETITPQEEIRLLGVNIKQNLTWNSHLEQGENALIPGIRKTLGNLKRISKHIPAKSRII